MLSGFVNGYQFSCLTGGSEDLDALGELCDDLTALLAVQFAEQLF